MSLLGPGPAVFAFDVGGTDIKGALVDATGTLRETLRVPTPLDGERTGGLVVERIHEVARGFAVRHPEVDARAVALVVPGMVLDEQGIGVFSENLGWRDHPFRDAVGAAFGLPAAFGHDVRAAGLAEFRLGAAAGFDDVIVLAIGTGIAAAVFIGGRLHTGGGLAGEIGHAPVVPDGSLCACGGRGCLESVASAAAIARRYNALTGSSVHGAREVLDRADAGDPVAVQVWDAALDALAHGLAHTVALLAPEAIVIGGGLSLAGERLFAPLTARLDALLTFHRRPRLLPAAIGADAGVIGAALLARDLLGGAS